MAFNLIIGERRVYIATHKRNARGREEGIEDIVCISAYMYVLYY